MNKPLRTAACIAGGFLLLHPLNGQTTDSNAAAPASGPLPGEFNDSATGARILLLSHDPRAPSGVIYFTQGSITPDSRYAVVRDLVATAGHTAGLMYRYDFKTGEIIKLTDLMTKNQVMVPKSGNMYYYSDQGRAIYVTNILDLKTRKVADLPAEVVGADGLTVNANETLVAGVVDLAKDTANTPVSTTPPNQGPGFDNTFERHDTNILYDVDIKTGKYTELQRIKTWLGHNQFSPVDPTLLMYCHEGPWAQVDRIWTVRVDNPATPQLVLKRTEVNEIAGHEFWSADGSAIWYDHNFRNNPSKHYLEGKNVTTGQVTRYPITAPFASIHYTQSPDGKFFVCDGGTNRGNPNAQAMFALVPDNGKLDPIKLCSMAKNNYTDAEPNPHLTPDQHWAIFTATFTGVSQAYAVEMPKQFWR
jgi:oligogalacturonide lyase